jgi:hypothetical protein
MNDDIDVFGLKLPRRHPSVLFGDGGTAKSYIALYVAGLLAEQRMRVAYFDWELAGPDHKLRLIRLFGGEPPLIYYARFDREIVHEVDNLQREMRDNKIEFAIFDSVGYASRRRSLPSPRLATSARFAASAARPALCTTPISPRPRAATRHNSARAIWYIEASELAEKMTIKQRMVALLKRGAMRPEAIAREIKKNLDNVRVKPWIHCGHRQSRVSTFSGRPFKARCCNRKRQAVDSTSAGDRWH